MKTTVTIVNNLGIHVRPSATIFKEISSFPDDVITLDKGDNPSRIESVLDIICLALEKGESVTVTSEGPTEEVSCKRIADLLATDFDSGFGFKR